MPETQFRNPKQFQMAEIGRKEEAPTAPVCFHFPGFLLFCFDFRHSDFVLHKDIRKSVYVDGKGSKAITRRTAPEVCERLGL